MQLNNFFLEMYCTTLMMVIRSAPNKNNQKVVEQQAVWRGHKLFNNNQMSRFLLSYWKFQQFKRFNSTLML